MVATLQYTDAQKLVCCMQRPSQEPTMSPLARICFRQLEIRICLFSCENGSGDLNPNSMSQVDSMSKRGKLWSDRYFAQYQQQYCLVRKPAQ